MEASESIFVFFFQAEDGIRDLTVTGVQTCALPVAYFTGHPECGARPKTYAFTSGGTRERSQDAGTPFGNTRKSLGHSSRGPEGYKSGQARQGRTRVGPADRERRGGKSGGLRA